MQSDANTDFGTVNPDTGFCSQARQWSCAAAAGAMLLWYVGISVSEADMRALMGTQVDIGTSDAGIVKGLRAKLAGTAWDIAIIWDLDLAAEALTNGEALLLHANVPDGAGGLVGHAIVILTEAKRGLVLKDPAQTSEQGLMSVPDIAKYNAHFAVKLVARQEAPHA